MEFNTSLGNPTACRYWKGFLIHVHMYRVYNLVPRSHSVLHWKVALAVGDLGTRLQSLVTALGMPSILLFHIWAENFFMLLIGQLPQLPSQVQTSFPGLSSPGNEVESNADSLLHVTQSVCRLAPQLGLKISIKVMRFACYRLALFVIF